MSRSLYRGTSVDWLVVFISNGGIRKQFNSVSKSSNSIKSSSLEYLCHSNASYLKYKSISLIHIRLKFHHPCPCLEVFGKTNFEYQLMLH